MSLPITSAPIVVERTGAERATLVRRTYGLVFASVIATVLSAAFGLTQPALMQAAAQHPWISAISWFLPLFLAQRWHREFPRNIALMFLANVALGVALSPVFYVYNRVQPGIVGQAALLTLTTFGGLSLYATFSRRDFSAWGGFFFVGVLVLLVTMVLNFFFHNQTADLWIAGATVFVFGGLLVFDTWRIMRSNELGPDDYVIAAVSIYVDLLNIFLGILRLLGGNRK